MNCWFRIVEFYNFTDLTEKLNEISEEGGVHDISVIDTESDIREDGITNRAVVKISGLKTLGHQQDRGEGCKVIT